MYDKADIGFINSHPECIRRHHDLLPVINEIILIITPLLVCQSRMIPGHGKPIHFQECAIFLHLLSGQAVDDPALIRMLLNKCFECGIFILWELYRKEQIRSVVTCHYYFRILQHQDIDHILSYFFRRCCSKCTHNRPLWKILYKLCDL